jgi:hypothetical protein
MRVLVIAEDPTSDSFLLEPIIKAMLDAVGKPSSQVRVCRDPVFRSDEVRVLLQAIARVNRPYEDEDRLTKPYGFVLDFVGIFEKLEAALAFDSDTVASVIQNLGVLQALFEALMRSRHRQGAGGQDTRRAARTDRALPPRSARRHP